MTKTSFSDYYQAQCGAFYFHDGGEYYKAVDSLTGIRVILPKYRGYTPYVDAMMQALYSRSQESATERFDRIDDEKSYDFMKKYYVGYGHDSIADCGSMTLFIEGISFYGAKCVQDDPLYNGQETSSRYVDFHTGHCVYGDYEVHSAALSLYEKVCDVLQEPVAEYMRKKHGGEGHSKSAFKRAVKAYIFDIARGFLPASSLTNLSWHTSIRKLHDGLARLFVKYEDETRRLAALIAFLLERAGIELFDIASVEKKCERLQSAVRYDNDSEGEFHLYDFTSSFDVSGFQKVLKIYLKNNPFRRLYFDSSGEAARWGVIKIRDMIDYGSWRDLQRHRMARVLHVKPEPYAGMDYDIEDSWYLYQVFKFGKSKEIEGYIQNYLNSLEDSSDSLYNSLLLVSVPFDACFTVDSLVYMLNLRSGESVHPTVRALVKHMGQEFVKQCGTEVRALLNPAAITLIDEGFENLEVGIRRGNETILTR